MVLRAEGAYRCGQQGGRGAFGMHVRGLGGRQAHAARPATRRRAQGVGRRRLSGPDGGDPGGRATGAGHDLPQNEVQKLYRRRSETKEYNEVESKSESRTCVPHPETRLRLRQGALSWHREEPSPALRELRPDQSLPASQTPGRTGGVVRPVASETGLLRVQIKLRFHPTPPNHPIFNAGSPSPRNQTPAQTLPKSFNVPSEAVSILHHDHIGAF